MAVEGFPSDRYSGRGLIVGRSADGDRWLQLYWLSGRSENSRNRVLVEQEGEIRTATADRSKQVDGTFTLYTALCSVGEAHIVGNGDQVTTVAETLSSGGSCEHALRTRAVEDDPPIWTPRITALVRRQAQSGSRRSARRATPSSRRRRSSRARASACTHTAATAIQSCPSPRIRIRCASKATWTSWLSRAGTSSTPSFGSPSSSRRSSRTAPSGT